MLSLHFQQPMGVVLSRSLRHVFTSGCTEQNLPPVPPSTAAVLPPAPPAILWGAGCLLPRGGGRIRRGPAASASFRPAQAAWYENREDPMCFRESSVFVKTEGRARAPWDRQVPVAGAGYTRGPLRNVKRRTKQTSPHRGKVPFPLCLCQPHPDSTRHNGRRCIHGAELGRSFAGESGGWEGEDPPSALAKALSWSSCEGLLIRPDPGKEARTEVPALTDRLDDQLRHEGASMGGQLEQRGEGWRGPTG